MKLLCLLILFNIWACGQTGSIDRVDKLQDLKISDEDTGISDGDAPVDEVADGLSVDYQQGYESNNGAEDQFLDYPKNENTFNDKQLHEPMDQYQDASVDILNKEAEHSEVDVGSKFADYLHNLAQSPEDRIPDDRVDEENINGNYKETENSVDEDSAEENINGNYKETENSVDEDSAEENINGNYKKPEKSVDEDSAEENINGNYKKPEKSVDEDSAEENINGNYKEAENSVDEDSAEENGNSLEQLEEDCDEETSELEGEIEAIFSDVDTENEYEEGTAEETGDSLNNVEGKDIAPVLSDNDNESNEYENQNLEDNIDEDSDRISDFSSNVDFFNSEKLIANNDQAVLDLENSVDANDIENIFNEEDDNGNAQVPDSYQNILAPDLQNIKEIVPDSYQKILYAYYPGQDDSNHADNFVVKDDSEPSSYRFVQSVNFPGLEEILPGGNQIIQDAENRNLEDIMPEDKPILPDSYNSYKIVQATIDKGLEDLDPDNYQNNNIQFANIAKELDSLSDYPSNFDIKESEPINIGVDDYEEIHENEELEVVEPVLEVKIVSFEGDEYDLSEIADAVDGVEIEYPYEAPTGFRKLFLLSGPLLMILGVFLLCVACCHLARTNPKMKNRGTALVTSVDYKPMMNDV